ncbi:MAG: Holliday junction branch migration protein RuvA [Pseudomonadota bacterium]|nr:Holliday junction branch migration protein RuvA [Pseudomonadota bacterium]
MIGRIRGVLLEASPPHLLLEVGGVGYEIETPLSTFERLPKPQSEVRLYTHLAVREDTHLLFGFLTETERRLFRALIRVNGVGARTALGVLSGTTPEEFAVWIETQELTRLTRLPGIGKKTAERLIVELRDRITDWRPGVFPGGAASAGAAFSDAKMDAISGLVALGYKPQEASRHVQSLDTEGLSSEAIIRAVLRGQLQA